VGKNGKCTPRAKIFRKALCEGQKHCEDQGRHESFVAANVVSDFGSAAAGGKDGCESNLFMKICVIWLREREKGRIHPFSLY